MAQELANMRARCKEGIDKVLSQLVMPPHKLGVPDFPFFHLCADVFAADRVYLSLYDRYSEWLSIYKFQKYNPQSVI